MKTKIRRVLLACIVVVALLVGTVLAPSAALAQAPVQVQMAMCLDGSGSISAANWTLMKDGLAAAVSDPTVVPDDGSVELCVIQFSTGVPGNARVEVAPTVVTAASVPGMVAAINAMVQIGGRTPLYAGIDLCTAQITGSGNFQDANWQVINITTDGVPNEGAPDPQTAAENSVAAAVAAGIDEVDAEGVGITEANIDWMALDLVYPDGSGGIVGAIIPPEDYPPRPPNPDFKGFVRVCDTWEDYVDALNEKFEEILVGQLTLSPPHATNPVGTEHCVTANLVDGDGNPVEGADITFTVTGANPGGGNAVTDVNGDATWCYTGTNAGQDTIVATAEDPENPGQILTSHEVYKDWEDGVPPKVPGITGWGALAAALALGGLMLVVRRNGMLKLSKSR
jgi:hypothetical protein